ncbi:PREDICTED: uncharacterized protein LOC107186190 [Dufourea novaeangliae]|nr:PREDICTED: uncharacterized protein LOC107186190 [Dufourea novaeangliae]
MPSRVRKPSVSSKATGSGKGAIPGKGGIPIKGGARSKGTPTKETSTKRGRPQRRRGTKAKDKIRRGKYTLKLKGWLKTPADWTRFNAWTKVNALPKKVPAPEPIVRPSKPLSQLRKRMKVLARHRERPDLSVHCRLDFSISKATLKFKPSEKLLLLAIPNVRLCDYGRVFYKVSPAALKYEASDRIRELSLPRGTKIEKDNCGESVKTKGSCSSLTSEDKQCIDEGRLNELAMSKKVMYSSNELSPEEIARLFTPFGVKRTALLYKITPWMDYLALPKYVAIKYMKEEPAKTWKKRIIKEGEERGKSALAKQQKKGGRKRKYSEIKEGESKKGEGDDGDKGDEEKDEDKQKTTEEKEKQAKKRKLEKHAWRYTPYPCQDDPYNVKKGALKGKVPPGTEKLAKPNVRESTAVKANPFGVRKSALSASASGRVETLAKPNRPRSPVERKPPREKDEYGKPIFELPPYGKVLPKTKPYKMGECPSKEKKKVRKKRPIDPIAYEQTYDPCIFPELAKKQKRERKRAEKLSPKKSKKRRQRATKDQPKKGEQDQEPEEKQEQEEGQKKNQEEEETE